ncbi:unnamed protein product, partial [Allacma fusca]
KNKLVHGHRLKSLERYSGNTQSQKLQIFFQNGSPQNTDISRSSLNQQLEDLEKKMNLRFHKINTDFDSLKMEFNKRFSGLGKQWTGTIASARSRIFP